MSGRLFYGCLGNGLTFADRYREEHGDYKTVAHFSLLKLKLEFRRDCPAELKPEIEAICNDLIARRGEEYEVSWSGQTVTLGGEL